MNIFYDMFKEKKKEKKNTLLKFLIYWCEYELQIFYE